MRMLQPVDSPMALITPKLEQFYTQEVGTFHETIHVLVFKPKITCPNLQCGREKRLKFCRHSFIALKLQELETCFIMQ